MVFGCQQHHRANQSSSLGLLRAFLREGMPTIATNIRAALCGSLRQLPRQVTQPKCLLLLWVSCVGRERELGISNGRRLPTPLTRDKEGNPTREALEGVQRVQRVYGGLWSGTSNRNSEEKRTLRQCLANDWKEPTVTNAAACTKVRYLAHGQKRDKTKGSLSSVCGTGQRFRSGRSGCQKRRF